jgi:uncharacterized membrane protein YcfT
MHSAIGVGLAIGDTGWLHTAVAFAKPFRMPDFFLIAGLFATSSIEAPFRRFLDNKVIHFTYFYALWLFVALAVKAHELGLATPPDFVRAYLFGLVQPFSSTWFIQVLPVLYLATRAVRRVPSSWLFPIVLVMHYVAAAVPVGGVYAMESQVTGWTPADGFLLFWVYFLIGVRYRQIAFALASWATSNRLLALAALLTWGAFESVATTHGWPEVFGLDLPFGLLGACAVIVASALLSKLAFMGWLGFLGRRSLIVYLAFFLPMGATRLLLLKVAPHLDVDIISLVVTVAAITGPLLLERVLRHSPLSFFFERPRWARIAAPRHVTKRSEEGRQGLSVQGLRGAGIEGAGSTTAA